MSNQVFDAATLTKTHEVSPDTKVVTMRRCWTVWFDVNGNAPADARIASFATKELADQALTLFAAEKDDDKKAGIVIGGRRHGGLHSCGVEGYDFDTYYCVQEDWREDGDIMTSLAALTSLCDEEYATDLPDGVVLTDDDSEEDEDEDNDD